MLSIQSQSDGELHAAASANAGTDLHNLFERLPSHRLAPALRRQMETAFRWNFNDVRIHASTWAHALNVSLNSRAVTIGHHVFFRAGAYAPHTEAGRLLLAHELAHVVQKGLGRDGYTSSADMADIAALEREADEGAKAACRGQRFECRLRDHALRPATWGCAGHFYAVYLAYLNAQASDKEAFKTALYCWLPDQVEELDAKHLFLGHALSMGAAGAGASRFHGATRISYLEAQRLDSEREYYQLIHRGIHCLNGGDSGKETEARRRVLRDQNLGFLLRGVAHHPFGDSFAHRSFRNPNVMYDVGIGHGTDLGDPDEPWSPDRGSIFLNYVSALQEVACHWTGKSPIVPMAALNLALDPVLHMSCRTPVHTLANLQKVYLDPKPAGEQVPRQARRFGPYEIVEPDNERYFVKALELAACKAAASENACCEHLKRVAAELIGRPIRQPWYQPVREPRPWIEYYREHKPLIDANVVPGGTQEDTAMQVLESIRAAAKSWNMMPR